MQHAARIGLIRNGESSGKAKLTNEQVKFIREVYIPRDKNFGLKALARKFGVGKDAMSDIINKKSFTKI